ncbi:hypothetical protein [Allorhizocola rhizosphaerae]|uniref:hypothetical protein n=1 Tax=Allorhizocola rhizosphaerae TaxID=1872709 RepID=UPI000E3B81A9|nr:hypothetical protein [Allorhizocola rhizosphaerae]
MGALLVFDVYSPVNLLMANYLIGTDNSRAEWHFWFLEVLIYYLVICAAVLSTPWGARLERRYPFALPASLMMSGPVMAFGFSLHSPTQYDPRTIVMLFWVFATGWAAARATKVWHRLVVSLAIVLTVPEFFLSRERTLVIIAGLLLLVWVKTVPSIRLVNIAVGTVASASLFIYVMHWQVFSRLEQRGMAGVSVLLACVVIGIAYSEAFRRIQNSSLLAHWRRRRSQDAAQAALP